MHIIVDGYNVLKQKYGNSHISLPNRRAFIALLGKYVAHKKHTIAVVFDGGESAWLSQEKDHGVIVIYAGAGHSADDVIKKMVQQKPHVLVVTDDGDIKSATTKGGGAVIGALEFYAAVKATLAPQAIKQSSDILIKTADEGNPFIDTLMQEASQMMGVVGKKEDEHSTQRQSKSYKPSKKERGHWQKIKKL